MMDLVYVWYDDRYWSNFYGVPSPCPIHDLKVKVMDLEFYDKSFTIKFLGPQYFQTLLWISFMFCMMIDTSLKF